MEYKDKVNLLRDIYVTANNKIQYITNIVSTTQLNFLAHSQGHKYVSDGHKSVSDGHKSMSDEHKSMSNVIIALQDTNRQPSGDLSPEPCARGSDDALTLSHRQANEMVAKTTLNYFFVI